MAGQVNILSSKKLALVPGWKKSWRWGSVRLGYIAGLLAFMLMNMPLQDVLALANSIPDQWRPLVRICLSLAIATGPHLARIAALAPKDDDDGA